MMGLFESLFDIIYLSLVIALGVRLVINDGRGSKFFGSMAILLGLGDAFHLIPRVISHLSPKGFEAHAKALSWGQFVTSITMTVFYVMYYFYYREKSDDRAQSKKWIIISLALIRIVLVMLPQNNWGTLPGNYTMGIVRNIPFAIMGLLLVMWSYMHRDKEGLKNMSLLIFLSFLFYLPVVLFVDKFPAVGALMMPKTIAYVYIVLEGYKHYIKKMNIYDISLTFLIMGLIGGVYFREFTRVYSYEASNHLGKVHVHTLVLGFILLLIIHLLTKGIDIKEIEKYIKIYVTGLILTITNMVVYGMYEILSQGEKTINIYALSGMAGIGHILLTIGLVTVMIKIRRRK